MCCIAKIKFEFYLVSSTRPVKVNEVFLFQRTGKNPGEVDKRSGSVGQCGRLQS